MGKHTGTFWSDFKAFITRGNVMDMAVGIIVGTAFTAIVQSLVNDIVMPVIGVIIGGVNFADLAWVIHPATETAAAVTLNYGNFIQKIINFLLIALVVFIMVRSFNKARATLEAERKKNEPPVAAAPVAPPAPPQDIVLLGEIRDLLKKQETK